MHSLIYDFVSEEIDVDTSMLDHSKQESMSRNSKTHENKEPQQED